MTAVREEAVRRAGQILPTRLYFPTVAFVLPDGRGVETEAASGTSLVSRVGDEVTVCYDPASPGRVHLEGTLRVTGAMAGVMLTLGLISAVLGAFGVAVVRALGI